VTNTELRELASDLESARGEAARAAETLARAKVNHLRLTTLLEMALLEAASEDQLDSDFPSAASGVVIDLCRRGYLERAGDGFVATTRGRAFLATMREIQARSKTKEV
jgi:hypothetical protein